MSRSPKTIQSEDSSHPVELENRKYMSSQGASIDIEFDQEPLNPNSSETTNTTPLAFPRNFQQLYNIFKDPYNWWSWTYIADWALVVLLLLASSVIFEEPGLIEPFQRYLPKNDGTISNPYTGYDIVPVWTLFLVSLALPIITFIICSLMVRRSYHDFHHALLGFVESVGFTLTATIILKVIVGRFRPDYLSRVAHFKDPVADRRALRDGRLSFPSGHASISFAAMGYVSLYLFGKLQLFKKHTHHGIWKFLLAFSPLYIATGVAVSRTLDYHHHFSDILAGSVLGLLFAFIFYNYNFYSLLDKRSECPRNKFYKEQRRTH